MASEKLLLNALFLDGSLHYIFFYNWHFINFAFSFVSGGRRV